VRDSGVEVELDRNAGAAERDGVGAGFVAEDVDLPDFEVRRLQVGRVLEGAGAAVAGTSGPSAASPRSAGQAVRLSS
jgi:hypothetical protein